MWSTDKIITLRDFSSSALRNKDRTILSKSSACNVKYCQWNMNQKFARIGYHVLQSAITSTPGTEAENVIYLKTILKMKLHLVQKTHQGLEDWHGNLDRNDLFKIIWHLFKKTCWWNHHPCQMSGNRHYFTRSHINSKCMQASPTKKCFCHDLHQNTA